MNKLLRNIRKTLNKLDKSLKNYSIELFLCLLIVLFLLFTRHNFEGFQGSDREDDVELSKVASSCGL